MSANNIRNIRERLGLSQTTFADAIAVSQASVSNYEGGRQEVLPEVARRVIAAALERGVKISFDDVYATEAAEGTASA